MGRDKAFLQLGGRTLLAHALALAGAVASQPWIVGPPSRFADIAPVVPDVYPGCGPLAGIHAALATTGTEPNLILAVDLPFVRQDFLRYLVARARRSRAVVVVPRVGRGFEPLCAVYRRSFAEVAERSLRAGRFRIDALFREVDAQILEPQEMARNDFREEMFRNLNTEQDWEEAEMTIRSTSC
jgi:molybdopterin-guanine dinucleotide biosynthesis protein A